VPAVGGERGTVLRRANRGFNVPGGTAISGDLVVPAGLFPENWISVNPQFDEAMLFSNSGSSNYHSLQIQSTLRPVHGFSVQGTYLWSKSMGVPGSGYTNPADRQADYALSAGHVTHDFRANGVIDLPLGPNKLLFANASGWVARLIENWKTSFIMSINSGTPASVTAGNMLYGNGVADVVRPLDLRKGEVTWGNPGASGQLAGNYFGGVFAKVDDPQCLQIASSLRSFCTLDAVQDTRTGEIVFRNPQPGQRGTIGQRTIELPGSWNLDASMSKTLQISESKQVQLRFDGTNILNHPSPGNPVLNINDTNNPFGYIASKGTQRREFKGQIRLTF